MDSAALLADLVLLLHASFVAFVVFGLLAVPVGALRGWGWVRDLRFRLAHLLAIAVVVAQAWLGRLCPLTVLEDRLRVLAGQTPYRRSFLADWLHRLLYYEAPAWVFTLVYTLFALLVLLAWHRVPPRRGASS